MWHAILPYFPFVAAVAFVLVVAIIVVKYQRIFHLIPAGGMIAAICFFLPWVKFEWVSGADLGGNLWIVLIASLAIVLLSILLRHDKNLNNMRLLVILSAIVGLGFILYALLKFYKGRETEFGRISAGDLKRSLQFGAYGSIMGLLLSLISAALLKTPVPPKEAGKE
jgi:hypothetical protein